MRCPIDEAELAMTERQGIEIDYCPKCRGVWLDRGELDKLIERSAQATKSDEPARRGSEYGRRKSKDDRDYHHKKRPKSLLGELFDF